MLADLGADVRAIQALLGHRSTTMALHYSNEAASGGRRSGARFGTWRAQSWKTPTVAMESFPNLPHKRLTEEYRPRWGARSSKPSGGAKASPVGSTPASSANTACARILHNRRNPRDLPEPASTRCPLTSARNRVEGMV